MQGFWVAVVGCLRTWPPVSAGKREDVSGPTWQSATWIWVPTTTLMGGDWKSSSTGCLDGEGHSWQSTPPCSPLTRDGVAQRGTATTNGKSLARARRRKELTYPELTGEHGRARLVVMGVEVGCRWSAETSERDRLRPITTSASSFVRLRPISTSANSISANFWMLNFGTTKLGREGWEGPKFRAFISFSRHNFHSSLPLLGSLRGILVVFEAPGP